MRRLRRKCQRGFGARVRRHVPALSSSVSAAGLGPPMPSSGRRWEFGHGAGSDARRRTRPPQDISATLFGLGATDDVSLSRGGSGLKVQSSLHHVSGKDHILPSILGVQNGGCAFTAVPIGDLSLGCTKDSSFG
jgi:hypothetical protein